MYVIVVGIEIINLFELQIFFKKRCTINIYEHAWNEKNRKKWKNEESKSSILDILQLKYIISER